MESDEGDSGKRGAARQDGEQRSYEVGYGKPPKATQFGVRPQPDRRSRSPRSEQKPDLSRFLDSPVEAKLNGRTTKLHPHAAMLHGLFARIVKGQLRPIKQLFREGDRAGLREPEVLHHSPVIHIPNDLPDDLGSYVFLREGPPPWDEETLAPYLAEHERDLGRLKLLKEEALREARARGEDVY